MIGNIVNSYLDNIAPTEEKRSRIIKFAILIATISVIIVVSLIIKFGIESGYSTIELTYVPMTATATIDGKTYNAGTIQLSPGTHEIVVQKYGFETQTQSFETSSSQTTHVDIVLEPSDSFTKNWYEHNQDDSTAIEGIVGRESDQARINAREKYPAFKKLPVNHDHFTIYQATCNGSQPCVMIDSRKEYRDEAINYFRRFIDKDMGNYYITFKNYTNPFRGEG